MGLDLFLTASLGVEQEVTGCQMSSALGGLYLLPPRGWRFGFLSVSTEGASGENSKELAVCALARVTFVNEHSAFGTAAEDSVRFVVGLLKKPHTEVKVETNLQMFSFCLCTHMYNGWVAQRRHAYMNS